MARHRRLRCEMSHDLLLFVYAYALGLVAIAGMAIFIDYAIQN
jgi:hypothetical protein